MASLANSTVGGIVTTYQQSTSSSS